MALPLFSFCFGPGNAYFVSGPQGHQSRGFSQAQVNRMVTGAVSTLYPRTSTGVGDTYVSVNAAGQAWFRLDGKYPELEQALRTRTAAIEMVVISPYTAGSFLIIYKHGAGYLGQLPLLYRDEVVEFVCQGMLPMLQQAQRQQAQTNDFLLNLLWR